jgi:hypothetical protein
LFRRPWSVSACNARARLAFVSRTAKATSEQPRRRHLPYRRETWEQQASNVLDVREAHGPVRLRIDMELAGAREEPFPSNVAMPRQSPPRLVRQSDFFVARVPGPRTSYIGTLPDQVRFSSAAAVRDKREYADVKLAERWRQVPGRTRSSLTERRAGPLRP